MSLFFEPASLVNLSCLQSAISFLKSEESSIPDYFKEEKEKLFNPLKLDVPTPLSREVLYKVDSVLIPSTLKTKLKYLLSRMNADLAFWITNNIEYLDYSGYFMDSLQWTTYGKLNIPRTVSNVARDPTLSLPARFMLSSKYCREVEMIYLWAQTTQAPIDTCDLYKCYWALNCSTHCDHFPRYVAKYSLSNKNICALEYVWPKLSLEEKFEAFNYWATTDSSEEILDFLLTRPELDQPELAQKKIYFILKLSLRNTPWHPNEFVSQLNTYKPFLIDHYSQILFKDVMTELEELPRGAIYEWRDRGIQFFKLFEPLIERCADNHILRKLLRLEDKIFLKLILNYLSEERKKEFVFDNVDNPLVYLIDKDDYEMVDYLLRLFFETDKEVAEFKIDFITKIDKSSSLPVLKARNINLYSKLVSWAALPNQTWLQFKADVLLNEKEFRFLANCCSDEMTSDVATLVKYFDFLFPSEEERAKFKTEVFNKHYTESYFISILSDTTCFETGSLKCKKADKFLDFCFPNEEERKSVKKSFFSKWGLRLAHLYIYYKYYDILDKVFEYFNLTPEEQLEYKIDVLINNGSPLGIINSEIMQANLLKNTDKIFEDCFTKEELPNFKRKLFLSDGVLESFKKLIESIDDKDYIPWGILKENVIWFNPRRKDFELFKSKLHDIIPNEITKRMHFKSLDKVK